MPSTLSEQERIYKSTLSELEKDFILKPKNFRKKGNKTELIL